MNQPSANQPPMMGYASLSDFRTLSVARRLRRLMLRQLILIAIGLGLLVVFVGLFLLLMLSPLMAGLGLIACLFVTAVAGGCFRAARRQRATVILSYCEQGIRLHAPLPEFLRAIAYNESPRTARRLLAIVETLEAPASLGSAIASELPELPLRYGELLRVAESSGTVVPTITRLVREDEPIDPEASARGSMTGAYIAITFLAVTTLVALLAVFVMPKLAQISYDFGIPLPWMSGYRSAMGYDATLVVFVALIVLAIVIVMRALSRNVEGIFFRRREHDRPFRAVTDRVLWHLPIVGGGIRDRDWGDICQVLADGLTEYRPLDAMLREAAGTQHLNDVSATRMERWLIGVARGMTASAAARAAGVPSTIWGMIGQTKMSADALAPIFAFLARHYRARDTRRSAWIAAAAVPAVTLVAGAIVAGVGLFLWIPLTRVLDAAMPYRVGL